MSDDHGMAGARPGGSGPHAQGPRSVAAGGDVGVAVTGDGARVVMLPAEAVRWAREVDAPPGAGNLPGSASGVFVGRTDELAELRRVLTDEGEAAVTQEPQKAGTGARAVHGLGGIGKSTLALHYAHTYRRSYTLVWWLNAASTDQIVAGLAALAMRLCPQWAASADVEERAAWALLWLQWHPGWLLVFDDVDNPDDLAHYLGALPDGHHLATSRRAAGWHAIAPTMPLGLLDVQASVDLLCTLALGPGQSADQEEQRNAEALAEELGYLPLALEQAGAYMFQTGTDLGSYRTLLGRVLDAAADGIDPERTIARIWHHTLAAIDARNPLASNVLRAMAWLSPQDIPRTLLAPLAPDTLALGEALGTLHSYNMISFTADRQGVSVHRLVQAVLRHHTATGSGGYAPGRHEAEQLVAQAVPDGVDGATQQGALLWEQLLPQVFALAASTPSGNPASTDTAALYHAAAQYLHGQGRDAHTIPLRAAALTQYEELSGDAHPDTLISRNNLAGAYESAGDLGRAIPLYETTLTQCEQILGDTHPDTLTSRNNLAYAYQAAGDLGRAIPLYETTLTQSEEVLGDTHPQTLASRNNLAGAYESAGDVGRAIPLFEATLTQREEILGDTHPKTLTSRNNLAGAYMRVGDLRRAIPLFEATLTQCEQILGDTHPDTLASRNNLAAAYRSAGDVGRAIPLFEATLTQCEQILGDTHPQTLMSRNNLAGAYMRAGDLGRAIPLLEATLTQCEQILGDTHPDTRISRNNLAAAYRAAQAVQQPSTATPATVPDQQHPPAAS